MSAQLAGRRVLITGAARGIGALLAQRLHERGAIVALLGLEPDQLEQVAAGCGGAPWFECDVADRQQVDEAVANAVQRLGGLEVAIANAGIGAQMKLIGGDPSIWDATPSRADGRPRIRAAPEQRGVPHQRKEKGRCPLSACHSGKESPRTTAVRSERP